MINKPQLILFDLDGTLVDSVPDLAYSVDAALQMLELPMHGESKIRTWVGRGAENLIKDALTDGDREQVPDQELFQKTFDLFSEIYLQNTYQRSLIYPGVLDALAHFKAVDIPMACVTNKRALFTDPVLDALKIKDYFSMVISGDTLARKKPEPDQLLHVASKHDIAPENCLMVGDSISDLNAARAAGMSVICVSYGYNHGMNIADFDPDHVVDNLLEITEMFPQ